MHSVFLERVRSQFTPPRYLTFPFSGIELSASGVKAVRLEETPHGFVLAKFVEERFPSGTFVEGEAVDGDLIIEKIITAAKATGISSANIALPESKSFIFETTTQGVSDDELRIGVEQHLDELIPLPPAETAFDILKIGNDDRGNVRVAGIGVAERVVDDTLLLFDSARIGVQAIEEETFAMARALLPNGDQSVSLIIDIGKTTTKIVIVDKRIPRFSKTINVGGHSFTLAIQKYFGVTEEEARKVKAEHGIVSTEGNEEYLSAMLSTASAIRDEISNCIEYWQGKTRNDQSCEPIARAILSGGNASVKGLPEYFSGTLKMPVVSGNVFTNFASSDTWIPQLTYEESLSYTTAIGLALYDSSK